MIYQVSKYAEQEERACKISRDKNGHNSEDFFEIQTYLKSYIRIYIAVIVLIPPN